MKLIIDIPEKMLQKINTEIYDYGDMNIIIHNGTPLDILKAKLYEYITHSPYIKSFMNCCRLRDDVMRIVDNYKEEMNNASESYSED